jgi:anti-anti-sigma regulatory factor
VLFEQRVKIRTGCGDAPESRLSIRLETKRRTNRLILAGSIDIAAATELKKLLLAAVANQKDTVVEIGAVTSVDVTTVQLLWAAERESRISGNSFSVLGPFPEGVWESLELAGFAPFPVPVLAK